MEIKTDALQLQLYGFPGLAVNKDYSGTAFKLADKMWQVIKSNNIKNKGVNIWVFEPGEKVFAGVELEGACNMDTGLQTKLITLSKYAYHKHIGSYKKLKQVGLEMRNEIISNGLELSDPYIEMYGHWNHDETKLETELLICLK